MWFSCTFFIWCTILQQLICASNPIDYLNSKCLDGGAGSTRVSCDNTGNKNNCPNKCCWQPSIWANQTPCYYPYDCTAFRDAINCGGGDIYGQSCYKYNAPTKSWADAFQACYYSAPQGIVGRLAWIVNSSVWATVQSSISSTPAWTGMYKWKNSDLRWMRRWDGANNQGYYVFNHPSVAQSTHGMQATLWWSQKIDMDYAFWSNGPSYFSVDTDYTRAAIAVSKNSGHTIAFVDDVESALKPYICEYKCNPSGYDLVGQEPTVGTSFMCGPGWTEYSTNKACYMPSDYAMWDHEFQQFRCRGYGGQLPTFQTQTDYNVFQNYRKATALIGGPVFLGHATVRNLQGFVTIDRTTMWTSWAPSAIPGPGEVTSNYYQWVTLSLGDNAYTEANQMMIRPLGWGYAAICQKRTSCGNLWSACYAKAATNRSVLVDGSCYVRMDTNVTWAGALSSCITGAASFASGVLGRLAWIQGPYVWNDLVRLFKPGELYHIGMKYIGADGRPWWMYNDSAPGEIVSWLPNINTLNLSGPVHFATDGSTVFPTTISNDINNYICEYRCNGDVKRYQAAQPSPNLPAYPTPPAAAANSFYTLTNYLESCFRACERRGGNCATGKIPTLTSNDFRNLFRDMGVECVFDTAIRALYYAPMYVEASDNLQGTCYAVEGDSELETCAWAWSLGVTRRLCHCTAVCNYPMACVGGVIHNGACFKQITTPAKSWTDAFTECETSALTGTTGRLAWLPYSNDWRAIRDKLFRQNNWTNITTYIGLRMPSTGSVRADFRWYLSATVPSFEIYFSPEQLIGGTFNLTGMDADKQCVAINTATMNTWQVVSCGELSAYTSGYLCEYTCDNKCGGGGWRPAPITNPTPTVCYWTTDNGRAWDDAKQMCWDLGGSLPTIRSASEWADYMNGTGLQYGFRGYYHTWLGARDWDRDDNDRWIDNRPFIASIVTDLATSEECIYSNVGTTDLRDDNCATGWWTTCQKRLPTTNVMSYLANQAYCRVLKRCANNTENSAAILRLQRSWNTKDLIKRLAYTYEFYSRFIANTTNGGDRLAVLYDALLARQLTNGSYETVYTDSDLFPDYRKAVDKILRTDYYNYRHYMDKIPGDGRMGTCAACTADMPSIQLRRCPNTATGWHRWKRCYYKLVSNVSMTYENANWTCMYNHGYSTLPYIRDINDVNDMEMFRQKMQSVLPINASIWIDGLSWSNGIITTWDAGTLNFSMFLPGQPDVTNPAADPPMYPPYCLASTADHRWDDVPCLSLNKVVCQICAPLNECPLSASAPIWSPITANDTMCINVTSVTFFTSLTGGSNGSIVINENDTTLAYLSQPVIDALIPATTTTDPTATTIPLVIDTSKRMTLTATIDGQLSVQVIPAGQGADLILCELDREESAICPDDWQQSDPRSSKCYKMFAMINKYKWDVVGCPEGSSRFVPDLTTVGTAFAQFIFYIGIGQVCPSDHFNVAGICYKIGDLEARSNLSYSAAKNYCAMNSSNLLVFDSLEQFEYIRIPLQGFHSGSAWINAHGLVADGRYNWVDGELLGYQSNSLFYWRNGDQIEDPTLVWAQDEPAAPTGSQRIVLDFYQGLLKTTPASSNHFAVCQSDITPIQADCKPLDKVFVTTTRLSTTTSKPYPMNAAEALAARVFQTMGCTFILVSTGVTIVIFLILRDFSIERCLHMGQEVCIFAGHMLVLTMRDKIDDPSICRVAGVGFQLFFTGVFAFTCMEALQYYGILTNIINTGGMVKRWMFVAAACLLPCVTTAVTATLHFQYYNAEWTCWVNLGHNVSLGTLLPVIGLTLLTLILTEAATMGHHKRMPLADKLQYRAALVNQKGMLFILPANVSSWFLGLFAVYYVKIGLFTAVFVLNTLLAVSVFTFHVMGNVAANRLVHKILGRWIKSCRLKDQTYAPEPEKPKPTGPLKPVYTPAP